MPGEIRTSSSAKSMKTDPIIAVKDALSSSNWYQAVLGCKSMHGGADFDILVSNDGDVILCLHKWGEHEHPTMTDSTISPGNGLILYFRTHRMEQIRKQLDLMGHKIEKEIELNLNSRKREFSVRDPDGYYLTISDYHEFQG
jgi:catechol 2,3-dioxygenase-like lactoylglutathione lyase family enzyme